MEMNVNKVETIGTSPIVISVERDASNGVRKVISLVNTGATTISISIDAQAVDGAGIPLAPGGYWSDSADGSYIPTQKYISAVSSGAGGTLAIQERVVVP